MTNDESENHDWSIDRRTVLKSAAAASTAGLVGVPGFSSTALAEGHELDISCDLDVMCAIDASGSLTQDDADLMEDGVNAFIDALPTDGSVQVGSLEFAAGEVRQVNGLQAPGALSVTVSSPGGDTPMPAALDIADQILYDQGRNDADKLIVLFTDGGPNYEEQYVDGGLTYTANDYTAPRDDTGQWSWESDGTGVYDNADGGTANVSEGEMDETALVAGSIRGSGTGGGATLIATVYVDVVGDDQNAMTSDAITTYTDLPTYLEEHIATGGLAIEGEIEGIEGLAQDLADTLEQNCQECIECEEEEALAKYEFECIETNEDDECVDWDFVLEDGGDENISYTPGSFVSKDGEDFEPMEVTFETTYCEVHAVVKSGQEFEVQSFDDIDGEITVGTANDDKYAISFVEFYCTEEAAETAMDAFPSKGRGRGR